MTPLLSGDCEGSDRINPAIKAHLVRGAFYLLLLVAVYTIPFALAQRNPANRSEASGTPPPCIYLINEDFEGTGAPANWGTLIGSPDYDYTAVPLAGSQSLRLTGNTTVYYTPLNNAEVWVQLLFKADALPVGGPIPVVSVRDASFNISLGVSIQSDGTFLVSGAGTASVATVDTYTPGTLYTLWLHFRKGSGSNAFGEFSFDVAGNPRPASGNKYASFSTGTTTGNIIYFSLSTGTPVNCVFDNAQVAATDCFGGTPTPPPPPRTTPTPRPRQTPAPRP